MPKVKLPKLHAQFAKVCEMQHKYKEAAEAWTKARELDQVVRLCLAELNSPERAFKIARDTMSSEAAGAVAKCVVVCGAAAAAIVCDAAAAAVVCTLPLPLLLLPGLLPVYFSR